MKFTKWHEGHFKEVIKEKAFVVFQGVEKQVVHY